MPLTPAAQSITKKKAASNRAWKELLGSPKEVSAPSTKGKWFRTGWATHCSTNPIWMTQNQSKEVGLALSPSEFSTMCWLIISLGLLLASLSSLAALRGLTKHVAHFELVVGRDHAVDVAPLYPVT